MIKKQFSKSLFEQYDELAKRCAKKLLRQSGFSVSQNKDRYEVDLIASKDGIELFFCEVEVKTHIKPGEPFPWDTLNIPSRKAKYCGLRLPTLFCLFSKCGTSGLFVWDKFVVASDVNEVSNKYVQEGEKFFQVPISQVDTTLEKALKRGGLVP